MTAQLAQYDVVILGGGAAGLMCALTAGQRGRRVLVLEKANRVGKKILMSGGGRCNFTNLAVEPDNFICANPHFCKAALSRYTQWDFIAMVERHGIDYEQRKHGQLFCRHSAKDIVGMLLNECDAAGVQIHTRCDIDTVSAIRGETDGRAAAADTLAPRYRLAVAIAGERGAIECASLVVATGALSVPTLGGSGLGYDIAQQFGLGLTPRRAGLVPFMFSDAHRALCEGLAGVSLEVAAIGAQLNDWQLKPSATEGYRTAEVTLGGVDTDHISSKTMAARGHPGLYFIGEVMDVSGQLGGFNFQWAWSSGYAAGLSA